MVKMMQCYLYLILILSILCFQSCNNSLTSDKNVIGRKKGPFRKAYQLYEDGNFKEAVDYFEKGLLIYPESSEEHLTLAIICDDNLKDNKKAAVHYEAYLAGSPDADKAGLVEKWLKLARRESIGKSFSRVPLSAEERSQMEEMDKEIHSLYKVISEKEKLIEKSRLENKFLEKTIEKFGTTIKENEKETAELKDEMQELHDKYKESSLKESKEVVLEDDVLIEMEEMDKEINSLNRAISEKEKFIERLSLDNRILEKTIKENEKKITELNSTILEVHNKYKESMVKENGKEGQENDIIIQKKMAEFENKILSYSNKIESISMILRKIRLDHERILTRLKDSLDQLSIKSEKVQQQVIIFKRGSGNNKKSSLSKIGVYRVNRGESLRIIASYDFIYGDKTKWRIIYNANKEKIRNPDILTPGLLLEIPRE